MALHTILGAGGAVGDALTTILLADNVPVRLVSRTKRTENKLVGYVAADLTNLTATKQSVQGSSVVYLLVGLPYDIRTWSEQWPQIMANVIEACKQNSARLLFFDNVYMYGLVQGAMTEDTPFNPISKKGEVRAKIAQQLLDEVKTGNISALIARSADFYGAGGGQTNLSKGLVFDKLRSGKKAQWLCNADRAHSLTYIQDAAQALYLLAQRDDAFGKTWHLPTAANPLTGREFVSQAVAKLGGPSGVSVLPTWALKGIGVFNHTIREVAEMAYQNDYPYLFDSTRFNTEFRFSPESYMDGISAICAA
jgi:nucleoside-diphosphate-sugar epimerase